MRSGPWSFLVYLVLPHPVKMRLLSPELVGRLDRVNLAVNVAMYSGSGASAYDQTHRYAEAEHHEYPAKPLVEDIWPGRGYGRALELGAGTGYFTRIIALRAQSVLAVEPVPDMQRVLLAGCATDGLRNVEILGAPATELGRHVPAASIDTAVVVQSLHHLHRRPEVFEALARVVRPGGRLLVVEPHHNVRRVARLIRKWIKYYRARAFWSNDMNWATHDFLTRREIIALYWAESSATPPHGFVSSGRSGGSRSSATSPAFSLSRPSVALGLPGDVPRGVRAHGRPQWRALGPGGGDERADPDGSRPRAHRDRRCLG